MINTMFQISEWKSFKYGELFDIKKGDRITKEDMLDGKTPCIRAIDSNNGISNYINIKPNHSGNTITVNYDGSIAEAFYQPIPYFALDTENILYPKFELNSFIAMFIITLIKKEKYRFNYGRKWHSERMKNSIIKLPIDKNGHPNWKFMENYIKSLSCSSLSINNKSILKENSINLNISQWKYFTVDKLFKIEKTKGSISIQNDKNISGKSFLLSSIDSNNGITGKTDREPHEGNVLTYNNNGSIGLSYYQPLPFCATGDVSILNPLFKLNKYIGLFLVSILNTEKYRYNFGRKANGKRLSKIKIKLPSKSDGTPDFEFMENYIKSLPYSSSL